MSRGRKPKSLAGLDSEQIFNKSQGIYFRYIATQLGERNKRLSNDEAGDLLTKIRKAKEKLFDKNPSKNVTSSEIHKAEIPFPIPSNWIWCKLQEMGFFTGGGTPSMSNSQYWDGDISWISPKDMGLEYVSESEMKITPLGVKNSAAKLIPPNSLLIVGRSGILKRKLPVAINQTECTVNQDMKVIIPYLTEMSRYLQIMLFGLQEIILQDYVKFGMTVHSLKYQEFEAMPVPLPPLSEQRKILEFLQDFGKNKLEEDREYFDAEIESEVVSIHQAQVYNNQISTELDHQLALVKELRQAYLREAMQGKLVPQDPTDEAAEILLEKIKGEKEKLVAEKRIKGDKPLPPINPEDHPFEVPSSWTWCRLGEVCTKIGSGSTPRGSNYSTSGIPFFRSQNIYNEGLILEDITFISDEVHKQMNGTKVRPNDILLNITGGSLGRAALVPDDFEEGNVSQHVCIIRPILVSDSFLHKSVLSPYFQYLIFDSTTGAGREGLPKYNLEQFAVPLPPLAEQERIVAKLEKLMKFCDELEDNIKQGIINTDLLLQTALREALVSRGLHKEGLTQVTAKVQ